MRFLPVGPHTLLVELADLTETLALHRALTADPLPAIAEIVPAARTLMVRTVADALADGRLAARIAKRQPAGDGAPDAGPVETVEIPMTYDGADLADVARHLHLTEAEVIAAHQAATWQVAFCGFAPGFAYMTCDDPRFDLPRRPTPRTRIPAGAVALGGRFCGVYPRETPGGWQLIGRTDVPMWDLARSPPALLRPGIRCRFLARQATVYSAASVPVAKTAAGLRILSTTFPILLQDDGRPGQAALGVSASGALDRGALHRANLAVGNPADSAALEITLGPVRLCSDMPVVLALAGASVARVDGTAIPPGAAFAVKPGEDVLIDPPSAGLRSYLAVRGGYAVAPVLGSASTDTLAAIGPPALVAGSVIAPAHAPAGPIAAPGTRPALPKAGDLVRLPVTLGPRTDWFPAKTVAQFLGQDWLVTPQSSRVGIRLQGAPLLRDDARELPSEGTEIGAIQVPHSGQPVLFLADHPLTGGYPVIATLLPEALDLAGQLPPGTRIRFTATTPFAPILPERAG